MAEKRASRDVVGDGDPMFPILIITRCLDTSSNEQEMKMPNGNKYKKVLSLAEKLAVAGMEAKAFEHFDSDDLGQYCWDVANTVHGFDADDVDDDDDDE